MCLYSHLYPHFWGHISSKRYKIVHFAFYTLLGGHWGTTFFGGHGYSWPPLDTTLSGCVFSLSRHHLGRSGVGGNVISIARIIKLGYILSIKLNYINPYNQLLIYLCAQTDSRDEPIGTASCCSPLFRRFSSVFRGTSAYTV